jgi:hypothetical protein
MQLKPGTRYRSAVCTTEIVVVKAGADADVDLRCGGAPMVPHGTDVDAAPIDPAHHAGTQIGKRYADDDNGLELLCSKGGEGSLSIGDTPIALKDAKPLPSSD